MYRIHKKLAVSRPRSKDPSTDNVFQIYKNPTFLAESISSESAFKMEVNEEGNIVLEKSAEVKPRVVEAEPELPDLKQRSAPSSYGNLYQLSMTLSEAPFAAEEHEAAEEIVTEKEEEAEEEAEDEVEEEDEREAEQSEQETGDEFVRMPNANDDQFSSEDDSEEHIEETPKLTYYIDASVFKLLFWIFFFLFIIYYYINQEIERRKRERSRNFAMKFINKVFGWR